MVRSALLAVLAAFAIQPAVPSAAAASPYVVFEAYRVKPKGPTKIPFRIYSEGRQYPTSVFAQLELEPDDFEERYRVRTRSFGETDHYPSGGLWTFDAAAGHRYFFVAPRAAKVRFLRLSSWWKVKEVSIGFRAVPTDKTDRDPDVAGTGLDQFHSASAPGGRYGSFVYADIPCGGGVGTWSLSAGAEEVDSDVCFGTTYATAETGAATTWSLEGPVLGKPRLRHRLIVLDFPKR